jgi:AraC-like DNA-binding protein
MAVQDQTEDAKREVDLRSSTGVLVIGDLEGGEGHGIRNATRGRNGGGRFTSTLKGRARDEEAARLQSLGVSLRLIAEQLGYSSTGHARSAIKRAFERVPSQGVEVRRAQQQALLDHLKSEALSVLHRDHVAHSQGRIVRQGCPGVDQHGDVQHEGCTWGSGGGAYCDGPVVLDDAPKLQAISTLKALLDREAKLHGMDAPVRIEQTNVGVVITLEGVSLDDL